MKVHELLTDASKWTQCEFARDVHGNESYSRGPSAVCWCLLGAVRRCYDEETQPEINRRIRDAIHNEAIGRWNDDYERTFEDVRDLVTRLDI